MTPGSTSATAAREPQRTALLGLKCSVCKIAWRGIRPEPSTARVELPLLPTFDRRSKNQLSHYK